MPGALEGITVVSLEQAVAAPLATSRLADAGARVIKLERPKATSRAAMTIMSTAYRAISSGTIAASNPAPST